MKKLVALLLMAVPAAADSGLYATLDTELLSESWVRTATGYHVQKGTNIGAAYIIRPEAGMRLSIWDTLIVDAEPNGSSSGVGLGVVGNKAGVRVQVGTADASMAAEYSLAHWFVTSPQYGYAYMVDRAGVAHSITIKLSTRLF